MKQLAIAFAFAALIAGCGGEKATQNSSSAPSSNLNIMPANGRPPGGGASAMPGKPGMPGASAMPGGMAMPHR